jgi:ubiquinone/menaquinone biosynthesis C-methylase UbiE
VVTELDASTRFERIAERVIQVCGTRSILDVGSSDGALVSALLRRGADARGIDPSKGVISRRSRGISGRLGQGSVLSLPFDDGSFQTVISAGSLECLSPHDVPRALREIQRVTSRFCFLVISTAQDTASGQSTPSEQRGWWESRCFEIGLRKHPAYYKVNEYAS